MRRFGKKTGRWAAEAERTGMEAARETAQRGAELARNLAPVDSGELRSGIRAQSMAGGGAVVSAAPHAAMVEYGTSRAAAQPYMLPMAETMRGEFAEKMRLAVKEVFA